MALTQRVAAAVVATGILLTGCTGVRQNGVPDTPSPTRWGPELTYDEAYARIPLAGTDLVPLYWRVPKLADAGLMPALLAVRRFYALGAHLSAQMTPDAGAYLYQWVATGRQIGVYYADEPPDPERRGLNQSRGPVWLRVLEVEALSPNMVRVTICRDVGWHGDTQGHIEVPVSNRAFHWHYVVVERRGGDGEPHWLVDQVWADWDLVGPEMRRECEQWATHKPGEEA